VPNPHHNLTSKRIFFIKRGLRHSWGLVAQYFGKIPPCFAFSDIFGYYSVMGAVFCPNDNVAMREVKAESHYGWPVILEQCPACGGLWFDRYELFSVKTSQTGKIEPLDVKLLFSPVTLKTPQMRCPRDGARLANFSDANFPREITASRCFTCGGFWLNRGEFAKYQKSRSETLVGKETGLKEQELKREIEKLLAENESGKSTGVMKQLGQFLNTPVDPISMRPLEPEAMPTGHQRAFEVTMNVLSLLFRLFVLKGGPF
jgi:Zn-finger nucleic acid-binding protein